MYPLLHIHFNIIRQGKTTIQYTYRLIQLTTMFFINHRSFLSYFIFKSYFYIIIGVYIRQEILNNLLYLSNTKIG
ncbi:hypothetical protein acsn021_08840 [Anaerocolumna cellulosilytica]|uniref:Uncharacterized protein n=1 Tax=Anaerocolumna cellulosilytica TaxID=433286 RepID=A0A6S6R151_9FIRM|nr:hypothetical protein acsn021_08840 [Anaerocolumna cellulosilytica]